jgi:hypothetical protein
MIFGTNNAVVKEDGSFSMDNVSPGKYYLSTVAPAGTYVKSIRVGSEEVLGREIDLSQGSGQMTIVFSYGPAELDGTVQRPQSSAESTDSSGGQPSATPDAGIVLVPDKLNDDGSGMYYGNAGAGGSFTIKQIPPGHYRAYAFEREDHQQLQNPEVLKELESKGTEVDLKQNDKKQVQLPLLTVDQMQQIYARLGIQAPDQ